MNNNYENNNNSKSRTNKNSRVEFAEDMNFDEQSNNKSKSNSRSNSNCTNNSNSNSSNEPSAYSTKNELSFTSNNFVLVSCFTLCLFNKFFSFLLTDNQGIYRKCQILGLQRGNLSFLLFDFLNC